MIINRNIKQQINPDTERHKDREREKKQKQINQNTDPHTSQGQNIIKNTVLHISKMQIRLQELCEGPGGRPGFHVPNKPTVSVDVKQRFNQDAKKRKKQHFLL